MENLLSILEDLHPDVDFETCDTLIDDGIIDLSMLVNGLRYKKISSQYFFHSAVAIKYLKKL